MVTKLKIRRDNSTVWNLINPVLEQGEPAVELDTGRMKIGDGISTYVELPYTSSTGAGGTSTIAWGDITGTIASNGALATALSNKEAKANKGIANGYAPLNEDAVIPGIHIPDRIPKGVIVMWSGTLATIPAGWALCDGTNGTPDLQNKFIRGATTATLPGTEGGADTVTLATTNLPSHAHTTTTGSTGLNLSATASIAAAANDSTGLAGKYVPAFAAANHLMSIKLGNLQTSTHGDSFLYTLSGTTYVMSLLGSGGTHTHTGTVSISGDGTTATTGSGQAIDILPTYYTLAYIIKI